MDVMGRGAPILFTHTLCKEIFKLYTLNSPTAGAPAADGGALVSWADPESSSAMAAGELVDSAGIVTSPTAAIGDFLMGYASRVVSFLLVITEVLFI